MPLANVLEAIRREASEEAERRLDDARQRVRAIEEEAHVQAARLHEQMEAAVASEGAESLRQQVQAARLQALRESRRRREDVFQQAQEEVRQAIRAARDEENYPALFKALMAEARAALPNAALARVDPRDADLDPSAEACLDTWGGVELEAADGRIVRNTLEERLRRAEPELRRLAARTMGLV